MAHTDSLNATLGHPDDYLLPELAPPKLGWMDSKGVFWHNEGNRVAFGILWIDRRMLDAVRPYGWRLLQYQRGNDMVQVGRTEHVARSSMENTDETD